MPRPLLAFFLVFTCLQCYGQSANLVWCKKCYDIYGKKLVRNLPVPDGATIIVKKRGSFKISFGTNWATVLDRPGKYNIDSIRSAAVKIRSKHDTIYLELVRRGLDNCNFKYMRKSVSNSVYGYVETDRIDVPAPNVYTRDSIYRIQWKHPLHYNGEYIIVITNLFEEYLAFYSTRETYLDLPLYQFKDIGYKVISEECRESRTAYIHIGEERKK